MSKQSVNQVIEEATTPPDLAELLEDLVMFVRRFLVLSPHQLNAIALWIAHTYIFQHAYCTPYLNIFSPHKRSGKSLLLEVLELAVAKPWRTGRTTVAVLARKVDKEKPTLLLDETDTAFKGDPAYSEALRGILNDGFHEGGSYSVCVGTGANIDYRDFSTYCPKAFASIGNLPGTIADRSIDMEMKRKTKTEKVGRFRRRKVRPEADVLKDALGNWTQGTECFDKDVLLPEELDDRAQDIWEILFQIAEEAGGAWPESARRAALALSGGKEEDDSLGIILLTDIHTVFDGKDADRLPSEELVKALNEIEESPWGDLNGKQLTARRLAALLKPYDIRPATRRFGGGTAKGYLGSDFGDAWNRYAPVSPSSSVTSVTSPVTRGAEAADEPSHKVSRDGYQLGSPPHGHHDVTDVTAPTQSDADTPQNESPHDAKHDDGSDIETMPWSRQPNS